MELPSSHRTLYMATCARGAIPLAVPGAYPKKDAPSTYPPAAVDDVCVPCPSVSRAELTLNVILGLLAWSPLLKKRAPMSFLLQLDELNLVPSSQIPLHLSGTGIILSSPKLLLSGQTPVSITPTITPSPELDAAQAPESASRWRNSEVWVVSIFTGLSLKEDTYPMDFWSTPS